MCQSAHALGQQSSCWYTQSLPRFQALQPEGINGTSSEHGRPMMHAAEEGGDHDGPDNQIIVNETRQVSNYHKFPLGIRLAVDADVASRPQSRSMIVRTSASRREGSACSLIRLSSSSFPSATSMLKTCRCRAVNIEIRMQQLMRVFYKNIGDPSAMAEPSMVAVDSDVLIAHAAR